MQAAALVVEAAALGVQAAALGIRRAELSENALPLAFPWVPRQRPQLALRWVTTNHRRYDLDHRLGASQQDVLACVRKGDEGDSWPATVGTIARALWLALLCRVGASH